MAAVSSLRAKRVGALATAGAAFLLTSSAQSETIPSYNTYGSPGLIDMPTAEMAPDATIGLTYGRIGDSNRAAFSFQITPWLSGTFRYAGIENFDDPSSVDGVYYDRSFDVRVQLLRETRLRPAVAIGLQDFVGTGLYGGEYIVATKALAPGLRVTGGLGWGRLGSYNSFTTIGERSEVILGEGGVPTYDRWFRGDVGAFGGISWSPNDKLTFELEYSSDAYTLESARGGFEHKSPYSFGAQYRFDNDAQLGLYYAYGDTLGLQLTFPTNPKTSGIPGGIEVAGVPVKRRASGSASDLGWTADLEATERSIEQRMTTNLSREKLELVNVELRPRSATVWLRNPTYGAPAQAIGRTARVMTRTLPDSVEEFIIVPTENGIPMSAVTMKRSDLEALENDAAVEMLARTSITDAYGRGTPEDLVTFPRFNWVVAPYFDYSGFDPDMPLRIDVGARVAASYEIRRSVVLSGELRKRVIGNLDEISRESESLLPRVRTDYRLYADEGDPFIRYLTLDLYGRPAPELYSRVSVGYLERMYAGVSGEVLWKPADSRLAFGAELNYVRRRAYDGLFGLEENVTVDPVSGIEREIPDVNGHVSGYYAFGNGFHGQVDVGRYLAGDYGATFTLTREFANGWSVGAFATFTDVTEEEFGEGSFDKGIMLTIPLSAGTSRPSRTLSRQTIRSLQRDGGARLDVSSRLYDQVRTWHEPDVSNTWGRFWR